MKETLIWGTRMRATQTITWLLILLNLCSASDTGTAAGVTQTTSDAPSGGSPSTVRVLAAAADTSVTKTPTEAQTTSAATTADRMGQPEQRSTPAPTTPLPPPPSAASPPPPPPSAPSASAPTSVETKPGPTQPPTTTGSTNTPTTINNVGTNVHTSVAASKVGTPTPALARTSGPVLSPERSPTSSKVSESSTTKMPEGNDQRTNTAAPTTPVSAGPTSGHKTQTPSTTGQDHQGGGGGAGFTTTQRSVTTKVVPTVDPGLSLTTSRQVRPATAGPGSAGPGSTGPGSTTGPAQPQRFTFSLLGGQKVEKDDILDKLCLRLMPDWQNGTCVLMWRLHDGKVQFDSVEINGKVKTSLAAQYYEELKREENPGQPTDYKTLIAILASCGALLLMIIILTVCASNHRKPCSERQQYLTEELQTVENCYHDNPTLEVMEVQPEMQEKKMALNGEFNDSWIVPIDNLMKEDAPDEEDTHL